MSLKCPLSTLRIDLPVRSKFCTHIQCFDATSFLQLQQQAPTWSCPTCNKNIGFNTLVVDKYFSDILSSTPKSVDSVTIDVDGKWSVASQSTASPPLPDDSDDEDCKEVINLSSSVSSSNGGRSSRPAVTPGRQTVNPVNKSNGSNKRPISAVIDLTLSDDEEEDIRPTKRLSAFPTPSSMMGGSNRGTPTGREVWSAANEWFGA